MADLPPAIAPLRIGASCFPRGVLPQPQTLVEGATARALRAFDADDGVDARALAEPGTRRADRAGRHPVGRSPDKQGVVLKALFSKPGASPAVAPLPDHPCCTGATCFRALQYADLIEFDFVRSLNEEQALREVRACCAVHFRRREWPSGPTSRTATRRSKRCLPRRRCARR